MVLEIASSSLVFHPKCLDDGTVYMTDLKSVAHLGLRVRIPLEVQRKIILNGDRVHLLSETYGKTYEVRSLCLPLIVL